MMAQAALQNLSNITSGYCQGKYHDTLFYKDIQITTWFFLGNENIQVADFLTKMKPQYTSPKLCCQRNNISMLKMMSNIPPTVIPILFSSMVAVLLFFDLKPAITTTTPNTKSHVAI